MVAMRTERFRSLFALVGVAVLASTAGAGGGNITTDVDEVGDLWLYGDGFGNELRVRASGETTDEFLVQGLHGTTIDGQTQVVLFAPGERILMILAGGDNVALLGTDYGSDPPCCSRSLVIVSGAGNDEVQFLGPFPFVNLDLGAGNDRVEVGEGGSGIRGFLFLGGGDDELVVGAFTGLTGDVDMGPGNDHLFLGHSSGSSADIDMGPGDDELELDRATGLEGEVQMGSGNDRVHGDTEGGVSNLLLGTGSDLMDLEQVSGDVFIRPGGTVVGSNRDDDVVTIRAFLGGSLRVEDDYGSDRVDIRGAAGNQIDPLTVKLGRGDDVLVLQHVAAGSAELDGGNGFDQYLDVATTFANPPVIVNFEARGVTPGSGAMQPAAIVGRVRLASGQPIPGATVLLPQTGLVATTDGGGRFRLGPVDVHGGTLEITAGAVVGDRHRTGAGSVVLQAQGDSDAGDIVLDSGRRNVLVFGEADVRTSTLEGNLLLLGFQPAEVTRTRTLPPDLVPYGVALHVGGEPLGADARARLAAFVKSGGGLLLTGRAPALDSSLAELANELLGGNAIQLEGGASSGPHAFNAQALDGLAQRPNVLTAFDSGQFSRVLTGARGTNAFVRLQSGAVVGGAWDGSCIAGGRGRLALLTSGTWMQPGESLDVVENLLAFLQRQPAVVPHR